MSLTLVGGVLFFLRAWQQPVQLAAPVLASALASDAAARPAPVMVLAVLGALGVGMYFLVIVPWRGHLACARGNAMQSQDLAQALKDFEQAVALDPSWDIYWTRLARAHQGMAARTLDAAQRKQWLLRARAGWDHLTVHTPQNGFHHDNRGVCLALLCQQGLADPDEVFAAFATGIRLDPTNPLFYADAADAALRLGRNQEAWDLASAGLQQNARYGPLHAQIGYLSLQQGKDAMAAKSLEFSLASIWDEHEDWKKAAQANLIVAYHRTGNYQKLEPLAEQFLLKNPEIVEIRVLLAQAQEQRGNVAAACGNYLWVLHQCPGHRLALEGCQRLHVQVPVVPVALEKTRP
jgi:tetratricopeptide (TPR) repeat protein